MKLSQWLNKKNRAEENRLIRIVRNSEWFDERWYVSQYQDVFKKLKDPARHYYQKGWKENREPSENFSTVAYLRRYPECEICPLVFEHNRNSYVDLSVCAIVKNEAPYIEEWLDYHMLVGVKRFYIYDNESTDNLKEVLAPYIAQGLVVYKYYPGEAKQMSAYNECIKEYKDMTEWLAFIDVDEFIIPTEKDNIPEFLKEFKDCPGVGINWISFDGNGYKKQPNSGVLESYTRVHYDDQFSSNHHIKSIVRPTMVEKYTNPHYAIYVDGENAVDENGAELKGCTYRDVHPKAYTDVVSVNKIRINHYYCKSEEEYKAKLARGRALTKGGKKQFSDKALMFDDIKYDCTAYKYAEILYPEAAQRLKTKELYYKIKNLLIELKHTGKPSGLCDYIDEKWYFEQYPDAKESGMTALQHYLSIGWKEGKNPSKYFDTNFYLSRYSDIADGKTNPLLHYLAAGKGAGRLPKIGDGILSDFDVEQLRIAVSKTDKTNKDYKLLEASELFDKQWYVNTYLNGEDIDPIAHYLSFGWQNGCNPSKDFDTEFYLKKYTDVAKSGQNPLLHYIKHGKEEGRSPKFNGGWLKRLWKQINGTEFEDDIVASSQETTEDYKIVESSKLFKQKWYARKYLQGQKINPIEHYLTVGWKAGNKPNAEFDTEKYSEENPDCGVCPLVFEHNRNEFADVAICAIMKNEGPYVKEWIDYHRLVGVRRFYIYDNESTDNMKEVLDPYIKKGIVMYEFVSGNGVQRKVYNECLKKYGDKTKWMAFIDADEFIVPKEKDSITEFLKDYEKYSGVGINWVNFDSNEHLLKPRGGVLENYSKVYYEDGWWRNHNIKSIVKPCDVKIMNVHRGTFTNGKYAVDENKKQIADENYLPYVSVNKIQINHYYCKSAEEATAKMAKGWAILRDNKIKLIKQEELNFEEYKYDYNIYKYLLKLKPEIAGSLKIKRIWLKFLNTMIKIKYLFKKDEIAKYIDENWYFAHYPEAEKSGLSARQHYLQIGWEKGYNPSEKFDTEFYMKKYPETTKIRICPLLNYLAYGKYEGREVLPDSNFEGAVLDNNEYVDLSVCAIMKNEAPYVKEWLDYHLSVGVKRFYIYDNESTDNLKEVLDPYIAKGVVVYKYYPGEARQMPAYNECIKEYKDKTEWLAVIDADEFIMPIEKDSIPEFLEEFKDCPGVGINWFCYDSNGYQNKPHGGLLESYTRVHFDDQYSSNHHIKSIVKPSMVEAFANPHYAQYKDGKNAVDENGNEMKGCLYRDTHPKAFTDVVSVNKIRINHYYCKSEEEYRAKLARGRAPIKGKKREFSIRSLIFEDTRYDCTAYKYAERLHPISAPWLEIKKLWLGVKNLFIYIKHWGKPCRMFDYIDEKWYFEQYPDAEKSGMTALQHYLSIGWKEGKNPSKYFDTNFYLNKYKDIARAEINPLLHYITVGKNAGRLPMAKQVLETDEEQPITENKDEIISDVSSSIAPDSSVWACILKWFKKEEEYNELWKNKEYFDEEWYISHYPNAKEYKGGVKAHYRREGWLKNYNPSEKFSTEEYLKQYLECKICPIDFEYNRNGFVDLSICAIMKNEAPYVKEWIDYHTLVGVKRFYIYDNESTDNLKEVLTPYIEKGVVVYKYYPGLKKDGVQTKAYNECIANYKDKNEWLAIIDADEFVVPVEKDTIPEFLKDYEGYPGVVINWMCFDSNKHINKPKGGVLENYTRCHFYHYCHEDTRVKCIVNPRKVSLADIHFHHYVNESKGEYAVDSNKSPVKFNQDKDAPLYDKIRINHYWCKSQQEYLNKVKKPRVSGKEFKVHKQNYDFNDGIYDYKVYRQVANLNGHFLKEKVKYIWSHILNFILYPERSILYAYIDERYYQIHYPEYKNEAKDAVTHYMTIGWKKGYNPSEKFDTKFYLEKYPDIAASKMNPLLHYVMHGLYSRLPKARAVLHERKEKKFFRIYSYLEKLYHFMKQQDSSRITKYMPYFDEKWYIAQYPEAKKYRGGAKAHYCKEGWRKEYNPSEKFSTEEYLKQYPECKICPLDFEYNRNGYVDLSIVAIMRNEGPYVKEWIDYHRLVGVKRFYIYDNESTDNLKEVLAPYIEQGIVVYKYFPGRKEDGMQTKAYTECINDYKDKTEWLAIIDADEFIVPMKKKNIPNFLKDYKEYPGVVVNWVVYDSNGHTDKPKGGVLENYARIHFSHNCNDDRMIKSIVNPRKVMYPEGHCSIYNNNECAVTENFTRHPHMNSTIFHSGNKIRINHYWTKSKSEYLAKIKKPRCNGIYLQETENHYNFKDFKYDYAVWKYVAKLDKKFLKEFFKYIQYSVKSFLIGMKHPPVPDINDYVDEKYYSQHYPEYKNEAKSALVHYMSIGWKRGYNPSDKFDTNYYLNRYHDIAKVGMNPLQHYVSSGYKEGRMPKLEKPSIWSNLFSSSNLSQNELYSKIYASKLFDKRWYLRHYSEVSKQHIDPLEHYLTTGWKKEYNPSNKFDTNFYLNTYPDIKQADINPLIHYLYYGKAEGRNIADVIENEDNVLATLYKKFFVKKLNNPKVSIIVASYNYEQYIRETLDSLINQTYKNFEVVVVDDGSKDGSVSVVKEYVNKYDNVFLFTHENGKNKGLVETVKLGISKSTGEYIAFCESDDYWVPTHLEEKVKLINKYFNPEIIVNDVELFGKEDLDYEKYLDNNLRTLTGEKININVTMQKYNVVPTFSCTMIRKDILTKCDFDSVVVAWTDWWIYRQILSVAPLYYIPQKLTFWRLHDSYNSSEKSAEYMRKYNEFIVYSNAIIAKQNKNFNSILENNENCQLIKSSDLFDEKWYLEQYKDVRDMHISASYHYNMLGWKKGYNPSSKFDTEAYLNLYPDIKELDASPLVHYIKHGKKEGRSCISCIHKPEFYNTKNISDRRYKRNILLVSHMLNHTGAPVLLKQVAELLNKKRYKVTVLSPKDGDLRDEILQVGADVIIDPNAFAKEQDCEYLKKYNFAFCICNTYINALIYSYLSKFIPSILWIHDNLDEKTANLIMPVLSTSKDIYAASKLTKSYMTQYNKNIKILTYPANDVVGNIRKCNADGHKPRIAVCAALQPRKGQDIFIEAVKKLPENIRKNAEFLLLGEESQVGYKEVLENMCQDVPEIKFVDAIKTPAEYHKFIDGLDILCCPSREDPCPLVVLDAFMHGVPVIISDHVGQKDIIQDKKDGYIFKSEDIAELSQILDHLIVSKEYMHLRTKSRKIFDRNYSDKTFLNDLFKIMEEKCAI